MFSEFTGNMDWVGLLSLLTQVAAILLCLTVHEASHGLVAYALGDPTAKSQHRLSLNPLRHIDPFGALMMLVAGFGWARPVPVDDRYFKNPKSGMALTALAGPVSNFVLTYIALLVRAAMIALFERDGSLAVASVADFMATLAMLSIGLGIFNLFPIPPLDGSKVLGSFLPDQIYYTVLRYERWGMLLLMALLFFGILDTPLFALRGWVIDVLSRGATWPYYLLTAM